jgi:hypothetical protein
MRSTRLTRRATAATGAFAGALALVVGPAAAAEAADPCTTRTTTQAFAAFGDTNDYFPIGGGTFESGDLSLFALTGSPWVTGENEPWRVLGPTDTRSVALPPGATLAATFCVQIGEDSMRLFAKSPGGYGSSLNIRTTVSTLYGSAITSSTLGGGRAAAWAPSPRIPLTNVSGPAGKQYVTLLITNTGQGTWLVDDILVDPWRTR